jgi:UDP-N-acetylmuramyl pentapeptide phosphotransferase/UDP-N-acetylglucosamine-1-phosphate transferase
VDDIRPLPWRIKLALQALCSIIAVFGLPVHLHLLGNGQLFWLERAVFALALLAFLNFVNFIDGIDEITVAHAAPALVLVALAPLITAIDVRLGLAATALLGAVAGFWLWNRHPARIFLGDAGSLPLGLLIGWLALVLALHGHWPAALLIILYPAADAGVTLVRRLTHGARLTQPHRDHAYQRAVDTGVPVRRVAATVALIATATAILAFIALIAPHPAIAVAALALGAAWVLLPIAYWLRRGPSPS